MRTITIVKQDGIIIEIVDKGVTERIKLTNDEAIEVAEQSKDKIGGNIMKSLIILLICILFIYLFENGNGKM